MEELDRSALRAYVTDKFVKEGDFDFLGEGELDKLITAMLDIDAAYTDSVGDGVYDDDDAYELIFNGLKARFEQYSAYCMRLAEDYLDFSEEYLASVGAIEWE